MVWVIQQINRPKFMDIKLFKLLVFYALISITSSQAEQLSDQELLIVAQKTFE